MRPSRLSFDLKGQGSYSILGSFDQLQNFIEFGTSTMGIVSTVSQECAPKFEIAHDTWVQFAKPSWDEMTMDIANEMVECWNEKYASDKYSPMREEMASFKSYCWGLESILSELSESEDCPPRFSSRAKQMMESQKQENQITWDTSQSKVNHLESEIKRLKEVIKAK